MAIKKKIGKKGFGLQDLSGVGLMFVLVGVTLGVGAYINSQLTTTAGWTAGSAEATAVGNATAGIAKLASWLPIIAVVIAAGAVIGILVQAFSNQNQGGI